MATWQNWLAGCQAVLPKKSKKKKVMYFQKKSKMTKKPFFAHEINKLTEK